MMVKKIARNNTVVKRTKNWSAVALSLFVFCLCGIIGVLVDIDHTEAYITQGQPSDLAPIGYRTYHIPLLIMAIGISIYICTSIGRLYVLVLKNKSRLVIKWQR